MSNDQRRQTDSYRPVYSYMSDGREIFEQSQRATAQSISVHRVPDGRSKALERSVGKVSSGSRSLQQIIFSRSYILLHSMIGYWHHPVVRLSVCDVVHCDSQCWCTGLKVAPACSQQACSYLSFQTLLLQDVSFSHKMHHKKTSGRNTCVYQFISITYC